MYALLAARRIVFGVIIAAAMLGEWAGWRTLAGAVLMALGADMIALSDDSFERI